MLFSQESEHTMDDYNFIDLVSPLPHVDIPTVTQIDNPGYTKVYAHLDDEEIERIAERVEQRILQKLHMQTGTSHE